MKFKKTTVYWFYIFFAIAIILASYSIIIFATNKPPVEEISNARQTLAKAKNNAAGKYAGETLREAESLYNQSINEWKMQNDRFFVFRDYDLTRNLAVKSYEMSSQATHEAGTARNKLQENAKAELESLKLKINKFEKYYKNLALTKSTFDLFNKGKTWYLEAQIEYKKDEYKQAIKLAYKALENISQAEKNAHFRLVEFYNDYPVWQKNAQLAFNLSKNGQTVVLVDKMQGTCIVLKSGKEYKVFSADLGISWMGDKIMVGDKATPEGVYKVLEKKRGSKTKYYKALLLDYPNREDKIKFDKMVKEGKIARNSGIGNLIEIHGEGGKGIHWTDGCIALENSEMDEIYNLCAVNTPVIIIGSRVPLEEYLN
jgi:tetratricopeptide (TPR) repeat protein